MNALPGHSPSPGALAAGYPTRRLPGPATLLLGLLLLLQGCSLMQSFAPPVEVRDIDPREYLARKRGDILSTGKPSTATQETVTVAGLDATDCARLSQPTHACRSALTQTTSLNEEQRLSALAELWVQQALAADDAHAGPDAQLQAWLEAARYAYAYLFFTDRAARDRAFEDRQTQVRDYYNLAVQEAAQNLFTYRQQRATGTSNVQPIMLAGWQIVPDLSAVRTSQPMPLPHDLIPVSSLAFRGLHSQYRRDGFGAELVAVVDTPPPAPGQPAPTWSEMPYPTITALLHFEGNSLDDVLNTRTVTLTAHDPYEHHSTTVRGQRVPLAGNFTAGYGLWLARAGFNWQSLRTLLGREHGLERPHLYLMQPYDPDRRILLMIHGLASSPEAWVNVANEVMGDDTLRENFQIWQVYYPTNLPIALNHADIRQTVSDAMQHFDPDGTATASQDMVLVGHSMGGVLARLMVSSSDDALREHALDSMDLTPDERRRLSERVGPMLAFSPMPGVDRAIFIAAPHRGTVVASQRLGRWLAGMVQLPLRVLENVADILQDGDNKGQTINRPHLIPNSVDNLQENDPFVQAAADLPLAPGLRYHSIIARADPDGELTESDDGLVPYRSSHLPGAASEKVIHAGHSVQETAAAILELRRILHESVAGAPVGR